MLITGESGTGKELVARAIHYSGPRAAAPFVPVNCGGIPEGLLESELFGYVKGAFTGAAESRAGFFQTADGGTIFLDEISETSLEHAGQAAPRPAGAEVYMVGSSRPRKVDVRMLAATNKNLPRAGREGPVPRGPLFPPERGHHRRCRRCATAATTFCCWSAISPRSSPRNWASRRRVSPTRRSSVMKNGYPWPGNVRELENVVHRLVVMAEGRSDRRSRSAGGDAFLRRRDSPT